MELAGITLDREGLANQVPAWEKELASLKVEIAGLGIANPSSASQLVAWLKPQLERLSTNNDFNWLSAWPRTVSGSLSTQAKHLRRLMESIPDVKLLVRYSAVSQLLSSFGDKLLQRVSPHTGRLHGNFLIAMAKSGRFSSSAPNLQNIPKSKAMRSVFVAGPGQTLVVADYSQLELRVMAAIAEDRIMTEAYERGLDLHAVTAASMLGIGQGRFDPANPIHKEARQKAKAVNFGVIYGSGPRGLREFARDAYGIQMSLKEAQVVIDRFLKTYPGVAAWQHKQAAEGQRTNRVSTLGGRSHSFKWEIGGKYSRIWRSIFLSKARQPRLQLKGSIRIDARLQRELGDNARLVLQVHDEFVVEVNAEPELVALAKGILEEEMVAAFRSLLPKAPTTGLVDAQPGPNWALAKG